MGRHPKPLMDHIADGTYRADKHGDRVYCEPIGDIGEPPADMPVEGIRYWQETVASLRDSLGESDRPILEGASRWWVILQRELHEYKNCFDDKDRAKAISSAGAASKAFLSFVMRLGASPIDRQRLRGTPVGEPEDDLLSLRRETA